MEETAIMVRYYQKNCFHYVVAELHNSSELCFHIGVAAKNLYLADLFAYELARV
jgi:hypothetical protein